MEAASRGALAEGYAHDQFLHELLESGLKFPAHWYSSPLVVACKLFQFHQKIAVVTLPMAFDRRCIHPRNALNSSLVPNRV